MVLIYLRVWENAVIVKASVRAESSLPLALFTMSAADEVSQLPTSDRLTYLEAVDGYIVLVLSPRLFSQLFPYVVLLAGGTHRLFRGAARLTYQC
jgi:hypothetical protein